MRRLVAAVSVSLVFALAACSEKKSGPKFYYDLGPDTLDVSAYSPLAQRGYGVLQEKCKVCHSPARPLNAPYTAADDWEGYLARMAFSAGVENKVDIDNESRRLILAFLLEDARRRKYGEHAAAWQAHSEALKKRFAARAN